MENFRRDFRTWLNDQFKKRKYQNGGEQYHKAWLEQVGNAEDFRQYVSAHCGWLWHELNHIRDLGLHSYEIPLWGEVCTMTAIPRAHQGKGEENVVTTPYIYSIFEKMYGPYLKVCRRWIFLADDGDELMNEIESHGTAAHEFSRNTSEETEVFPKA